MLEFIALVQESSKPQQTQAKIFEYPVSVSQPDTCEQYTCISPFPLEFSQPYLCRYPSGSLRPDIHLL